MPVAHDITLSEETMEFIQTKVSKGEYTSESKVLNESITMLREYGRGFEEWVHDAALPSYQRLQADQTRGIPLEQVKANIAARRDAKL